LYENRSESYVHRFSRNSFKHIVYNGSLNINRMIVFIFRISFHTKSCKIQQSLISAYLTEYFSPLYSCKLKLIGRLTPNRAFVRTNATLWQGYGFIIVCEPSQKRFDHLSEADFSQIQDKLAEDGALLLRKTGLMPSW